MVKTPVVSSKTRVMVYVLKRLSWRRRPLNLAQRNLITITPPLLPLGEMGATSIVQSRCRLPSSWQARPRVPYNYPHRFRMKVNGDRATGGLGGTETVASLSEVVIRLAHRIDRSSSNSFRREGPKLQYMQNKGDGQDLEAMPGWHAACSSYGNRPTGKSPARADCGVRPQVGSNTLPQMSGSGVEVGETPVR